MSKYLDDPKQIQVRAILDKYHRLRCQLTNDDTQKLMILHAFENMELDAIIGDKNHE